jgi:N6-adenosine-specific RNA methylase IME4
LWATNPKLPDAFRVMEAWGFEFKSMLTWAKMQAVGAPRIGLGYHARACTEQLLIGTKGSPPAPKVGERPNGLMFSPRGEHSRKPDYQYELAEHYPGPWLEVFCRPREGGLIDWRRPEWTYLGNEVDGRDIRDALLDLARQEEQVLELA